MNEEKSVKELPTQNGVYTDLVNSDILPTYTDEEADLKEQEQLPNEEGGK